MGPCFSTAVIVLSTCFGFSASSGHRGLRSQRHCCGGVGHRDHRGLYNITMGLKNLCIVFLNFIRSHLLNFINFYLLLTNGNVSLNEINSESSLITRLMAHKKLFAWKCQTLSGKKKDFASILNSSSKLDTIAESESFYYVKYRSSIIKSEIPSKILSNENKKLFPEK